MYHRLRLLMIWILLLTISTKRCQKLMEMSDLVLAGKRVLSLAEIMVTEKKILVVKEKRNPAVVEKRRYRNWRSWWMCR